MGLIPSVALSIHISLTCTSVSFRDAIPVYVFVPRSRLPISRVHVSLRFTRSFIRGPYSIRPWRRYRYHWSLLTSTTYLPLSLSLSHSLALFPRNSMGRIGGSVTVPLEGLSVYQMIRDSVELNVPMAVDGLSWANFLGELLINSLEDGSY